MSIQFNNRIHEDKDGYLVNFLDWTEELADYLAELESIKLEQNHWSVVWLLRRYYEEHSFSPMLKILNKLIAAEKGIEKKKASQLLYQLFPGGPYKQAFKIAGLPKPTSCV